MRLSLLISILCLFPAWAAQVSGPGGLTLTIPDGATTDESLSTQVKTWRLGQNSQAPAANEAVEVIKAWYDAETKRLAISVAHESKSATNAAGLADTAWRRIQAIDPRATFVKRDEVIRGSDQWQRLCYRLNAGGKEWTQETWILRLDDGQNWSVTFSSGTETWETWATVRNAANPRRSR